MAARVPEARSGANLRHYPVPGTGYADCPVLSGYTLGGADMLRRAMGKKKPEEMAKQRGTFEEGARKNGIDGELAIKIFDLVENSPGTDLTNPTLQPMLWSLTRRCG